MLVELARARERERESTRKGWRAKGCPCRGRSDGVLSANMYVGQSTKGGVCARKEEGRQGRPVSGGGPESKGAAVYMERENAGLRG